MASIIAGAECFRFFLRRGLTAARDRHDIDIAKTPHGVDMVRPDKARTDNAHSDPFHVEPSAEEENGKAYSTSATRVPR